MNIDLDGCQISIRLTRRCHAGTNWPKSIFWASVKPENHEIRKNKMNVNINPYSIITLLSRLGITNTYHLIDAQPRHGKSTFSKVFH